jgi:hypothetical protein
MDKQGLIEKLEHWIRYERNAQADDDPQDRCYAYHSGYIKACQDVVELVRNRLEENDD